MAFPKKEKSMAERLQPFVSVIIPTHNRSLRLERTLNALQVQTYPEKRMEVVVVADGCADGTLEMLRSYKARFPVRILEQYSQGPGAARNYGASRARGSLLLFLDDDVEPTPSLVEAHVRAHRCRPGEVVLGPYPLVLQSTRLSHLKAHFWWETLFRKASHPSHRYAYDNLCSGNLSIASDLFRRMGRFNPEFWVHEDYEFGVRLIKAGVGFRTVPEAVAHHYETSDFSRLFRRKRDEGRADLLLLRRHREPFRAILLSRLEAPGTRVRRRMRALAFRCAKAGDILASFLQFLLEAVERRRMRSLFGRFLGVLNDYWYWRGLTGEFPGPKELLDFLRSAPGAHDGKGREIDLDLSKGLGWAEQRLDRERPTAARIRYGRTVLGRVPPGPGVEPLRGAHLRGLLANDLAIPLLMALALEGRISSTIDRVRLCASLERASFWFGRADADEIWFEHYQQWSRFEFEKQRIQPGPTPGVRVRWKTIRRRLRPFDRFLTPAVKSLRMMIK
jgi:glycosyltransferase involved in cell wall biosynthesis